MGEIKRTDTGWLIQPTVRRAPAVPSQPDAMMARGRLVRVIFDMILPNAATREEIEEWVTFALGSGSLSLDSPLGDHDLEMSGRAWLEDLQAETDLLDLRDEALERGREQLAEGRRNR